MAKKMIPNISVLSEKTTLVGADLFIIEDSESSNAKKKVQLSNILASENLWDRTGTVLSPHTASDDVALGAGDLSATDVTAAGVIYGGAASTTAGSIVLYNATNAYTTTIQSGVATASYVLTLPVNDGDASQVLQTNGSGVLSWATVAIGSFLALTGGTMSGDITFSDAAKGIVLKDSSGAFWRITADTNGNLETEAVV